jgi:RND family efflux transporter MFP subunit
VIGAIDNSLREINLAANELSVERYQKDYNRYKALYEGKAATELDYINAKYNYENAVNQAAQTRQQITDGIIASPLNGVIIKKNVEEGEFVNTGTVIATIITIADLKARVMMSENDVYRIKSGMPVSLSADVFPGQRFKGVVGFISPRGDEGHNYQVDINIQNSGVQLKAGTFVRVAFKIEGNTGVLQIPKMALVEGMQTPYVYVAKGNRAEKRKLVLGRETGEMVEVLTGLTQAEQLITSGQINLSEGSLVEILDIK